MTRDTAPAPARWVPLTGTVLALLGLAISIYLTINHYTDPRTLACPDTGALNCVKVTTSPESVIFGIPVAAYGLLFFAVMILVNLPSGWRRQETWVTTTRLAATGIGVLTVLYLVYVELFRVNAIFLWCTGIHVIAFALFVIALIGSSRSLIR
ncbi:vitamin K epoxide reductase family protein [Streptosporangium subroseum]|uniref:vitamin K epoxide reductase family protein n=1 Tax=Streptosporangium subroseum TaxID=106412 RepID=UPI00343B9F1E